MGKILPPSRPDAQCISVYGSKKNKVEVFDIASFWGLGENSTTGNVVSIDSTASKEHGTDPRSAIDKALDNELRVG